MNPVFEAQLPAYLQLSGKRIGLLIKIKLNARLLKGQCEAIDSVTVGPPAQRAEATGSASRRSDGTRNDPP